MGKWLKSCTCVLLRADLTGHGHPTLFGRWAWMAWTLMQEFNSFSIMFYYIISTTYKKIGDLFCPVVFLDFRTVCSASIFSLLQKSLKARECQLKKHLLACSFHFSVLSHVIVVCVRPLIVYPISTSFSILWLNYFCPLGEKASPYFLPQLTWLCHKRCHFREGRH